MAETIKLVFTIEYEPNKDVYPKELKFKDISDIARFDFQNVLEALEGGSPEIVTDLMEIYGVGIECYVVDGDNNEREI